MIQNYMEILEKEEADCVVGAVPIMRFWLPKSESSFVFPLWHGCTVHLRDILICRHDTYGMLFLFEKYASSMDELFVLTEKDREIFMEKIRTLKRKPLVFYNPLTIPIAGSRYHKPIHYCLWGG